MCSNKLFLLKRIMSGKKVQTPLKQAQFVQARFFIRNHLKLFEMRQNQFPTRNSGKVLFVSALKFQFLLHSLRKWIFHSKKRCSPVFSSKKVKIIIWMPIIVHANVIVCCFYINICIYLIITVLSTLYLNLIRSTGGNGNENGYGYAYA